MKPHTPQSLAWQEGFEAALLWVRDTSQRSSANPYLADQPAAPKLCPRCEEPCPTACDGEGCPMADQPAATETGPLSALSKYSVESAGPCGDGDGDPGPSSQRRYESDYEAEDAPQGFEPGTAP